jgi:hypothetical protein
MGSASKFLLWKLIFIAVCLQQRNKQNGLWAVMCLDETRTSKARALSACAAFAALAIKTRKK